MSEKEKKIFEQGGPEGITPADTFVEKEREVEEPEDEDEDEDEEPDEDEEEEEEEPEIRFNPKEYTQCRKKNPKYGKTTLYQMVVNEAFKRKFLHVLRDYKNGTRSPHEGWSVRFYYHRENSNVCWMELIQTELLHKPKGSGFYAIHRQDGEKGNRPHFRADLSYAPGRALRLNTNAKKDFWYAVCMCPKNPHLIKVDLSEKNRRPT